MGAEAGGAPHSCCKRLPHGTPTWRGPLVGRWLMVATSPKGPEGRGTTCPRMMARWGAGCLSSAIHRNRNSGRCSGEDGLYSPQSTVCPGQLKNGPSVHPPCQPERGWPLTLWAGICRSHSCCSHQPLPAQAAQPPSVAGQDFSSTFYR